MENRLLVILTLIAAIAVIILAVYYLVITFSNRKKGTDKNKPIHTPRRVRLNVDECV